MRKIILISVTVVTGIVAGVAAGIFTRPAPQPLAATLFDQPRALPDLDLVDHHGAALGPERFRGAWDLLFFGFTRCPDICPMTLGQLRNLAARLPAAQLPRIWLVSVDPEHDTPEVLGPYIEFFDPRFGGITGSATELQSLTTALGVAWARVPQGDDYTISHSAALFLIDPDGDYAGVINTPHRWADIETDLRNLLR